MTDHAGDRLAVPALCATRRAVLLGAGATGAVVFLAACGGGSGSSSGTSTGNAGPPEPAGPAVPSTTGDPGVIAKVSDVPVGGGAVVGAVLLVQPTAGVIKAFNAHCKHLGTIVDPPENGVVTCPAHGSQYRAADGSLLRGPATSGLTPIAVKVEGGSILFA